MFTASLDARSTQQWSGQDWVLVPTDGSPWGIPMLEHDGQPTIDQWFAGQAAVGGGTTTHAYVFDAKTFKLSVRRVHGELSTVEASHRTPGQGLWMLGAAPEPLGGSGGAGARVHCSRAANWGLGNRDSVLSGLRCRARLATCLRLQCCCSRNESPTRCLTCEVTPGAFSIGAGGRDRRAGSAPCSGWAGLLAARVVILPYLGFLLGYNCGPNVGAR